MRTVTLMCIGWTINTHKNQEIALKEGGSFHLSKTGRKSVKRMTHLTYTVRIGCLGEQGGDGGERNPFWQWEWFGKFGHVSMQRLAKSSHDPSQGQHKPPDSHRGAMKSSKARFTLLEGVNKQVGSFTTNIAATGALLRTAASSLSGTELGFGSWR